MGFQKDDCEMCKGEEMLMNCETSNSNIVGWGKSRGRERFSIDGRFKKIMNSYWL